MRILVCGGKDYNDTKHIFRCLDALHKFYSFDTLIEGDARGADRIAGYWARKKGLTNLKYPVTKKDWYMYGKAAGPRRNRQMLVEGKPDLVVAFPGGPGTLNMIRQAEKAEVDTLEIQGRVTGEADSQDS